MDLRTYLRNLILLPRTTTEAVKDEYNYPEKSIACLNSIRDHYTKYHTTLAIFYPSAANTALLTVGGSIASLEAASLAFTNYLPAPTTPFQLDVDFPVNLRNFLITTTMGYIVAPQVMTSTAGKRYVGANTDRQIIVNRVTDKGSTSTVVVGGQNTTVVTPPAWWSEINGTTVLSTATVPTGDEVVSIINDILNEAYAFYAIDPTIPVYNNEDISSLTPTPYWLSVLAKKLPLSKVSSTYAETILAETYFVNFSYRELMKGLMIENGTGLIKDKVSPVYFPDCMFSGYSPAPTNYLSLFPVNDNFIVNFTAIFGDWFEIRDTDVTDKYYSDFINGITIDPKLTTETNMGSGNYYAYGSSSSPSLMGSVNYFLKDNVLNVISASTGVAIPKFTLWYYNTNSANITIARTTKQKIIFNKATGMLAPTSNYAGSGFASGATMSWILNLLVKARMISKNSWLNQDIVISPYVKFFTAGKVTLQYLQSIQVRDTILKTEKGQDLYLFPSFLVYSPSLLTDDPYNPVNYRVDSVSIKAQLASAILYITTQLFAQDIATLNTISSRFDQSINVNVAAKAKLDSEYVKMNQLDADLNAKLLEAKKLFTTLDILKANLGASPDPVLAYQQQVQSQMDAELLAFTNSEKLRLAALAEAKRLADIAEAQRLAAIAEAQRVADVAEAKRLTDLAEAKRLADIAEAQRIAAIAAQAAIDAENKRLADVAEAQRVAAVNEAARLAAVAEANRLFDIATANEKQRQLDMIAAKKLADDNQAQAQAALALVQKQISDAKTKADQDAALELQQNVIAEAQKISMLDAQKISDLVDTHADAAVTEKAVVANAVAAIPKATAPAVVVTTKSKALPIAAGLAAVAWFAMNKD